MFKMVDRAPVSRGDFNKRERARNIVGACSADRFGRRDAHKSAAREFLKQPRWVLLGFFVIASEGRNALPRELAHLVANGGLRFSHDHCARLSIIRPGDLKTGSATALRTTRKHSEVSGFISFCRIDRLLPC